MSCHVRADDVMVLIRINSAATVIAASTHYRWGVAYTDVLRTPKRDGLRVCTFTYCTVLQLQRVNP